MGNVIQGVDILDYIRAIDKENKKFQAITLQNLEELLEDKETYRLARKIVLDSFNSYTRAVIREIFGDDFEFIGSSKSRKGT